MHVHKPSYLIEMYQVLQIVQYLVIFDSEDPKRLMFIYCLFSISKNVVLVVLANFYTEMLHFQEQCPVTGSLNWNIESQ